MKKVGTSSNPLVNFEVAKQTWKLWLKVQFLAEVDIK